AGFSVAGSGGEILIGAPGRDIPAQFAARTDAGIAYRISDTSATGNVSLTRVVTSGPNHVAGRGIQGEAGDALGTSAAFVPNIVQGASGANAVAGAPGTPSSSSTLPGKVVVAPPDTDPTTIVVDAREIGVTRPGAQIVGTQNGEGFGSAVAAGGDSR